MTGYCLDRSLESSQHTVNLTSLNLADDTSLSLDVLNTMQVSQSTSLEREITSFEYSPRQRKLTSYTYRETVETCWEFHLSSPDNAMPVYSETFSDPNFDNFCCKEDRVDDVYGENSVSQYSGLSIDDGDVVVQTTNTPALSHEAQTMSKLSSIPSTPMAQNCSTMALISQIDKFIDMASLSPTKDFLDDNLNTLDAPDLSDGSNSRSDADSNLDSAQWEESYDFSQSSIDSQVSPQDDAFYSARSPALKRKREHCNNFVLSTIHGSKHDEDINFSFDPSSGTCKKKTKAMDLETRYFDSPSTRQCSSTESLPICAENQTSSISSHTRVGTPIIVEAMSPVPIIAPPEYCFIPAAPFSLEDASEARIRNLLKREKMSQMETTKCTSKSDSTEEFLATEKEFLQKVVKWLLDVVPPSKARYNGLRDQLDTSPETRYDAIVLLNRYLLKIADDLPKASKSETKFIKLARRRMIWDSALSCLALAIKFHRDFLAPFTPMNVREFLGLAPHAMSPDDFEICQKDILMALNYNVWNVTPGCYMQEIWASLSSLRSLLNFEDGWRTTREYTWDRLNLAFLESCVLQFPISVLTAAAMIDGILEALIAKYEVDLIKIQQILSEIEEKELEDKAIRASKGVAADVIELLDISKTDVQNCRKWINGLFLNNT